MQDMSSEGDGLAGGAAANASRRLSPLADERSAELCECVLDIVAALFNVSGRELREAGRSSMGVARVRQIGMYVAHVILGLNMTEVGRGFGRDRTTVQHACHLVEDMRDDDDFDRIVNMVERVTAAALRQSEAR
ncbi:chromosomal replication initiator DnaA-like protein [Nitratireductor indicus C115]|uniref:Chromosomal replication initiator DnaA-like protein n=2 Tax=Nitratireductor indicus TaxID=721133 RepID=K2P015_9HYPH|nr:chromosomal replication initiator DnaA-like protein [Nitratireductor indicus C115]